MPSPDLVGQPSATLTVNEPAHSFGNVPTNGMQSATFTITNSGDASSGVPTVGVTGSADMTVTSNGCTVAITASSSCMVTVKFQPTIAGDKTGTLTVSASPGGSVTVTLTGKAIVPGALVITPDPVAFGNVSLGAMPTLPITIKNTGDEESGTITLGFTGSAMALYSVVSGMDSCTGAKLVKDATCTATLRLNASVRGAQNVSIGADATPGGPALAAVTANVQAPAALAVSVQPPSTDFGTIDVGASSTTQTFTVRNDGDVPTGNLTITGANAEFTIPAETCSGAPLQPGTTCEVSVQLTPGSAGAKGPRAINVVSASPATMVTVSFTGMGRDKLTLTADVAGTGSGSVTAPAGAGDGIACDSNCTEDYYRTTSNPTVTLTATPGVDADFTGWSEAGCPKGSPPYTCTVTLSAAKTVTATFTIKTFTVTFTRTNVIPASTGTVNGAVSPAATGSTFSCTPGACTNSWTGTYNYGSTVVLDAIPTTNYYFGGWGGDCASAGFNLHCEVASITANASISMAFTPANVLFTTSTTYTQAQVQAASTSGTTNAEKMVSGADAICKTRAAAGTKTSSLGTNFVAWISRTGVTALSRLNATKTPRGWVRASDGKPFGDQMTTSGILGFKNEEFYPPALDENGATTAGTDYYWTGTESTGLVGPNCTDWTYTGTNFGTNSAGSRKGAGGYFSRAQTGQCDQALRIACLQADYTAAVRPPPPPANVRMAFITNFTMTGLANADAACQTAGAAYGGTFKAVLATFGGTPSSAASRFVATNADIYRPDGVIIGTDTNFLAGNELAATLNQQANGSYLGPSGVWTGQSSITAVPTAAANVCRSGSADWSLIDGATSGYIGSPATTISTFAAITQGCGSGGYIYCLK